MNDEFSVLFEPLTEAVLCAIERHFDPEAAPATISTANALVALAECRQRIADRSLGEPDPDRLRELRVVFDGIGTLYSLLATRRARMPGEG